MKWFDKKASPESEAEPPTDGVKKFRLRGGLAAVVVLLLVVACLIIMVVNYRFPEMFDIQGAKDKQGQVFTEALIAISEEMASNWLPNDKIYPTIFLDNPQNFQMGLLEAVRYSSRVLRDKLSRMRTTDKIDPDVEAAFVYFSNDPYKWILPSAESKFRDGVKSLRAYETRLLAGQADFYSRADNLNELLDQYVSLLGGVTTRLSNAPRRKTQVVSEETSGDAYTKGEKKVQVEIPWTMVDDNFYYSRGVAYGLRQMMLAVKYDFANILEVKKAEELVDRILEVLDQSQFEPWVVLNGRRGSVFANHSLQLQSVLEDARQKMRSLQDMIRD